METVYRTSSVRIWTTTSNIIKPRSLKVRRGPMLVPHPHESRYLSQASSVIIEVLCVVQANWYGWQPLFPLTILRTVSIRSRKLVHNAGFSWFPYDKNSQALIFRRQVSSDWTSSEALANWPKFCTCTPSGGIMKICNLDFSGIDILMPTMPMKTKWSAVALTLSPLCVNRPQLGRQNIGDKPY